MAASWVACRRLFGPCFCLRNCSVSSATEFVKLQGIRRNSQHSSLVSTSLPDVDSEIERVSKHSLRGKAMRAMQEKLRKREPLPPPRELRMKEDQDWSNVYPTAAPFKWSAVPLPLRMGYPVRRGVPPHKYGNAELLKIPNFLHLTPPAIKKHCAALKEFCTEWPEGLETDEDCEKHFPLEVITSDYVFSGASLRHPDARIVTLKLKLRDLPLDKHAHWKLVQLAGKRYNKKTETLTLTTDRCPVRKQNLDYAMYLMTVLLHEAWVTEPWEADITEEDMEEYVWDISASRRSVMTALARMKSKDNIAGDVSPGEELDYLRSPEVSGYRDAVTALRNTKESHESLERYKAAALNLLQVSSREEAQPL
ncbi:28S ribosomal protein S35, mitochondrial-like [Patiria miniata]|uniref:Small ribosomal subunit protein mS35 mitochondrial conserved domain-containing protein n=1 Tax=Patiria miniata TaxID=46514 RepID=A0A913ZD85_PATMI|nr:28S ribosomal protein S35, mitochondrial-like [Patiria miniata]